MGAGTGRPGGRRAAPTRPSDGAAMHRRTTTLVTLATAAVAVGLVVPALATSGGAAPTTMADTPGSGRLVIDWNRELISILGTPNAQPTTVHPTR